MTRYLRRIITSAQFVKEKESSKSPTPSEKEKNFPYIINNMFTKKFDDYSKFIGINKKLFFKIVRIKVLYNKIRSIINIIKAGNRLSGRQYESSHTARERGKRLD